MSATARATPPRVCATASPSAAAASAPATASLDWPDLRDTVAQCQACGLCGGRSHTVFGTGQHQARWLFVGEGPGMHEDQQGEPFVGPAGQLLDNMLLALGLNRQTTAYITNVVKCRARDAEAKDRSPHADEIAACLPYLERQIELLQPQVIVALGKTAALSLLGLTADTALASLRGQVHQYRQRPLIVTFHPAYLLRKPLEKSKAWADLCLAQQTFAATVP